MHILSPETDNCPSWISGRERMTVEKVHDQSPRKNVADLGGGWTRDLLVSSRTAHPTEPPRPTFYLKKKKFSFWRWNFLYIWIGVFSYWSDDNLYKQSGLRSGQTKCRAWSGSKLFDTLMIFLKDFSKNVSLKKSQTTKKYAKLSSMKRVKLYTHITQIKNIKCSNYPEWSNYKHL